jgi:citrate lyase alpha subunit
MDDEDDYLSDKFLSQLASSSSAKPTTYADRRKEAQRLAHIRNEQGRTKSRKELEEESRREGLSKSLFERAKEEGDVGGNKAMAMMLKMGYKPGQALGKDSSQLTPAPTKASEEVPTAGTSNRTSHEAENPNAGSSSRSGHLVEPISVSMWAGSCIY